MIRQVVPDVCDVELQDVAARLGTGTRLAPFEDETIEFCAAFSRLIFKDREAVQYPELQALAFWMRKAELHRLRQEFTGIEHPDTILSPRGVVFHVPPSNVDTIFIYSWLISVLTGNRNVLRLSTRSSPQTEILCRLFREALSAAPEALRDNTIMLQYGHEADITAALSAACDVRVIWGGDATVNTIRAIPLPPHARELTFPDRFSFAVVDAEKYLAGSDQAQAAEKFYNDAFWFDQMACSSPRLVFWLGSKEAAAQASETFMDRLAAHAEKKAYEVQPATRINRFTFACRAILDGHADSYDDLASVVVLDVEHFEALSREHCGGGLLFQYRLDSLDDLKRFVQRRDQTMTYYGLEPAQIRQFAADLRGRGVDRIVPMGQALNFHRFWDGNDLLAEFTRRVFVGR